MYYVCTHIYIHIHVYRYIHIIRIIYTPSRRRRRLRARRTIARPKKRCGVSWRPPACERRADNT